MTVLSSTAANADNLSRQVAEHLLLAALQVMPIEWKAASEYQSHREEAERRIAERDPDERGSAMPRRTGLLLVVRRERVER